MRQDAADKPADVDAQLAVADMDLAGGHVEDAFGRLVETPCGARRVTTGSGAPLRLLELFEVMVADDPRVVSARRALARGRSSDSVSDDGARDAGLAEWPI